jgi:hypothetical protein
MAKYATVVVPYAGSKRWGQIILSCLKNCKTERDFDIILLDNEYLNPVLKDDTAAITETSLGDGIKILKGLTATGDRLTHSTSLDYALNFVDTPYMFTIDSDCSIDRDGWLDWYASFMKDEYVAMVGWYWSAGENVDDYRHLIAPCHTLYNTRILKQLQAECLSNQDTVISYGENYSKRIAHNIVESLVKTKTMGPFSETRGFYHMYPVNPKREWFACEPGHWLYNRASSQWECVRVPGDIIWTDKIHKSPQDYNWVGPSDQDAYVRHYWAGTVSHEYDRWMVLTPWKIDCTEWWIRRENSIWEKYVPDDIKAFSLEKKLIRPFDEELKYAMSRCYEFKPKDQVRVFKSDMEPVQSGKLKLEDNLNLGNVSATVIGWDYGGLKVVYNEKPPEDWPYKFDSATLTGYVWPEATVKVK